MTETRTVREIDLVTKLEAFARPITMSIYSDGAISFSTDFAETFIYLYPDIVKRVKKEIKSLSGISSSGEKK